jgi:hypothetical protein
MTATFFSGILTPGDLRAESVVNRSPGDGSICGMLSPEDETRAVTEVSHRLVASFPDVAPDVIKDTVHSSYDPFAGSPIRDFVPVLVERIAKSTLTTQVRAT